MFRSVRIQNFRQFKDLKLENLGRINLITGQNNTGKTSLLEALFLLDNPGDPNRTTLLANFRGIGRISSETPEHWDWLFLRGDTSRVIEIEGEMQEHQRRMLRISLSHHGLIPRVPDQAQRNGGRTAPLVTSTEPLPLLIYDADSGDSEQLRTEYRWTSQGLLLDPDRRLPGQTGFFLPDYHRIAPSDAVRVSQLEARGLETVLVDALRVLEPRLRQLRVLDLGDGARIYADLGERPYVPVSMMGAGIARVLTIVAAMALRESPIMFVDEIAEGLHHRVMADVWKAIIAAAHQHDVQLFVTTHSLEAIEAAVEGSEGYEGSLAFFRLERQKDGEIGVVEGSDSRLRSAVSLNFELR